MPANATVLGGLCILGLLCGSAAAADVRTPILAGCRQGGSAANSDTGGAAASQPAQPPATAHPRLQDSAAPPLEPELKLDAAIFFQKLVDRYRGLHLYKDIISVVQVTQREGAEPARVETQITCEVAGGKLKVQTPASQARQDLGLNLPVKQSQPMQETQQKYDLWLAPHMALKFTDEPLKQLRAGVDEGFTPTEAQPVTIDNKKMVHVELRSGDGLSQDCAAKFDLYVNSDSMLIERIEGAQRLPDGANYSTTLQITPQPSAIEPAAPAEPAPTGVPAT